MKKVLSIVFIGALMFTSCKSNTKDVKEIKETEVIENTTEVVKKEVETDIVVEKPMESGLVGITIPSFSNDKIVENLKAYTVYARDYIAANGNVAKITAIAAKGKKLLDEGREMASKLPKEEQEMYAKVMAQIQSKMAPAN